MVLQRPRLFPANHGNWNDSLVVTSTLCLTFGLLLAQFVWNGNVLLWSFLYWGKRKSPVLQGHILYSQLTQLWFYITYTAAHWVKVSVLDLFWPSEKGFYCSCFFPSNEIFQWQFDYLPLWRQKEPFEDRLTFPLLSTTACSAFPISPTASHLFTLHPQVPCKYLWYWENFYNELLQSPHNRKEICPCMFVYLCGVSVVSLNGICSGYLWLVGFEMKSCLHF